MTGLNDHHILAMVRMWAVTACCDNATNPAMVKGEGAKMFGNKNNGKALILVRAKSA